MRSMVFIYIYIMVILNYEKYGLYIYMMYVIVHIHEQDEYLRS